VLGHGAPEALLVEGARRQREQGLGQVQGHVGVVGPTEDAWVEAHRQGAHALPLDELEGLAPGVAQGEAEHGTASVVEGDGHGESG
jgi:hypothetical protein